MERLTLGAENNEYEDGVSNSVLKSQEILDHKMHALESQSLFQTVAETDGLTPLIHFIVQEAVLPFL